MSLRAHGEVQTDGVSFLSTELPSGTAHQGSPAASVLARPLTSPLYCWSSHQWVLRVPRVLAFLPNITPGPNMWIQSTFFSPPAWIFFLAFCMLLALPLQPPSLFVTRASLHRSLKMLPLSLARWKQWHSSSMIMCSLFSFCSTNRASRPRFWYPIHQSLTPRTSGPKGPTGSSAGPQGQSISHIAASL